MKTRSIAIICAIVLIGAFCLGFALPLANPAFDETQIRSKSGDLVVGYLLTREHLDLYDHDAWLEDNIDDIIAGKYENPTFDPDDLTFSWMNSPYAGRLYAELREKTLTNNDGETVTTHEYVFPGVEGISFFTAYVEDGEGSYFTSITDDAVTDGKMALHQTDDGEERTLEGTLYVTVSQSDKSPENTVAEDIPGAPIRIDPDDTCTVYFNPVCQASDGSVYVTTGFGYSWANSAATGSLYSQTITGETVQTVNGERTVSKCEITVHVAFMHAPLSYQITEMSADTQVLSAREYAPGTLPKEQVPGADTAYLLLETRYLADDGTERTEREIINHGEENLSAFAAREDGICVKSTTRLLWE